MKSQRN